MQNAAQREDIVENNAVGDQVVVLDDLALLITMIGCDSAITAERDPLCESVESLALVRCRLD